ncbi:MAG: 2-oxoacid:acceptor oxidoreductase family protein [Myxococcales bacterium]
MIAPFNVFVAGVGGQGIGLFTEVLGRACLKAGHVVHGCDTHGLAQRGGTVLSHLRLGEGVFTPRVPEGAADLVVALERLEALRAVQGYLKPGGALLYYDAVYQPMAVRLGKAAYPEAAQLDAAVQARGGKVHRVAIDGLADPRMQNSALLGALAAKGLVPRVDLALVEAALRESVPATAAEANLAVFRQAA